MSVARDGALPVGVEVRPLETHPDVRGDFTELFRDEWDPAFEPVQWNLARSEPGTLRGMHVHPFHDDYVVCVSGHVTFGLRDLRRGSPTENLSAFVELYGSSVAALVIPAGVTHGNFHHDATLLVVGVTRYWDPINDEIDCHWADPELELEWPGVPTRLSEKDAAAPPLTDVLKRLENVQWRATERPA